MKNQFSYTREIFQTGVSSQTHLLKSSYRSNTISSDTPSPTHTAQTNTRTLPGCVYTSLSFHHSLTHTHPPWPSLSLCLFSELLFALCHRPFTDLALIWPLCSIAPLSRDKIAQNIQTCLALLLSGVTKVCTLLRSASSNVS